MRIIVYGVLLVLLVSRMAAADPQVTAVYHEVVGGYRLHFTVRAGAYSVDRWGFYRIDAFDLASPNGWHGLVFTRYTDWTATSPDYELPPGQILLGCAATLPELPTQVDYFVMQMAVPSAYYGTLIPTPIPEPSSLFALAGGALGIVGFALRWKRRIR